MDSSSPDLAVRNANDSTFSPLTQDLLFTLLVLVLVSTCSAIVLLFVRRRRQSAKEAGLPFHNANTTLAAGRSHHRRTQSSLSAPLCATQQSSSSFNSFFARQEKQPSAPGKPCPPAYALPEIRIHFPEEVDESGKQCSARVVSVRVGETGFGLEPVEENQPPPYQKDATDRFHSLDLERLGGLKEKEIAA